MTKLLSYYELISDSKKIESSNSRVLQTKELLYDNKLVLMATAVVADTVRK
jgi:hypothetical protein